MKKQILFTFLAGTPFLLTSCFGQVVDVNYVVKLINDMGTEAKLLPTKSEAATIEEAAKSFNEYLVSDPSENNYQMIQDEIIFSCLNFISKTNSSSEINGMYPLNKDDTFLSLFEQKKINMQTKITNLDYKWNDTEGQWNIDSSVIIISVQFRDDYNWDSTKQYQKGSVISYDFFLHQMYLKYVPEEKNNRFYFNNQIGFRANSENVFGIVEAVINNSNPPVKSITELPQDLRRVNNYYINKK